MTERVCFIVHVQILIYGFFSLNAQEIRSARTGVRSNPILIDYYIHRIHATYLKLLVSPALPLTYYIVIPGLCRTYTLIL